MVRRSSVASALALCALLAGSPAGTQERRPVSLLLLADWVVTLDPARPLIESGALAVDGERIVGVGAADRLGAAFEAAEVIDLDRSVLLPGLINTHTHAPMVLYRGLADDLALMDWLQKYIFPAEARTVSPEFVRIGTRLAALEMIRSGTTTFTDMYYFEEAIAEAAREAGLRGVLGQSVIEFPVPDAPTPADALRRAEAFIERFRDDPLITPAVAPHSMYTLDRETLVASRELAAKYGVPLLIHLAETNDEVGIAAERHAQSPAAYLDAIGFWGAPRTVAAHGVWLSDADLEILEARGVAVAHNPESNMKLASGTAPVPAMLDRGIVVGLGTDGAASNNDLDMFDAMRTAALLHKLSTGDPRAVPASAVLEMATLAGARALGLDSEIGSLVEGKKADVIAVRMDGARQAPIYDPVSHLVYVSKGSDVSLTMVNGRVLLRDGQVRTLDEARVLADARRMAAAVQAAVGEAGR